LWPHYPFKKISYKVKNHPKSAKNHENCEKLPDVGEKGSKQPKTDPKGSPELFLSLLNPKQGLT
jgi:hypothetical protein